MRKELKVDHAQSMNNGIRFYSKRHKNYFAIATIDEEGNIKAEWTTIKEYEGKVRRKEHEEKVERKEIFIFILFALPFVTMFFFWAMSINFIYAIRTFMIEYFFIRLVTFIVAVRSQEKNAYKFHSAEHMALNAYRKLKRVPSLEEIYQYSRFSNTCGTNTVTEKIINCILMFACSFIPDPFYMSLGILSVFTIVSILSLCGCLNFLQKFTTMTPTDKELLVAIKGLTV